MSEDFIPTKGSARKNKEAINFQAVKFESYKSKAKNETEKITKPNKVKTESRSSEFNIKKAKHEVIKFGMSGFDAQQKAAAKVQLAIKLGAKPLKNKYKNYKLLQKERAQQKENEKLKMKFQQLGKNSVGKSVVNVKKFDKRKRKNKGGLLDMYGKVKNAVD